MKSVVVLCALLSASALAQPLPHRVVVSTDAPWGEVSGIAFILDAVLAADGGVAVLVGSADGELFIEGNAGEPVPVVVSGQPVPGLTGFTWSDDAELGPLLLNRRLFFRASVLDAGGATRDGLFISTFVGDAIALTVVALGGDAAPGGASFLSFDSASLAMNEGGTAIFSASTDLGVRDYRFSDTGLELMSDRTPVDGLAVGQPLGLGADSRVLTGGVAAHQHDTGGTTLVAEFAAHPLLQSPAEGEAVGIGGAVMSSDGAFTFDANVGALGSPPSQAGFYNASAQALDLRSPPGGGDALSPGQRRMFGADSFVFIGQPLNGGLLEGDPALWVSRGGGLDKIAGPNLDVGGITFANTPVVFAATDDGAVFFAASKADGGSILIRETALSGHEVLTETGAAIIKEDGAALTVFSVSSVLDGTVTRGRRQSQRADLVLGNIFAEGNVQALVVFGQTSSGLPVELTARFELPSEGREGEGLPCVVVVENTGVVEANELSLTVTADSGPPLSVVAPCVSADGLMVCEEDNALSAVIAPGESVRYEGVFPAVPDSVNFELELTWPDGTLTLDAPAVPVASTEADLALVAAEPERTGPRLTLVNLGPDPVQDAVVTGTLDFVSRSSVPPVVSLGGRTCTLDADAVTCPPIAVAVDEDVGISINLQGEQRFDATFTVRSSITDNVEDNNSLSFVGELDGCTCVRSPTGAWPSSLAALACLIVLTRRRRTQAS